MKAVRCCGVSAMTWLVVASALMGVATAEPLDQHRGLQAGSILAVAIKCELYGFLPVGNAQRNAARYQSGLDSVERGYFQEGFKLGMAEKSRSVWPFSEPVRVAGLYSAKKQQWGLVKIEKDFCGGAGRVTEMMALQVPLGQ